MRDPQRIISLLLFSYYGPENFRGRFLLQQNIVYLYELKNNNTMANINNPELVSFANFMLAKHGVKEVVTAEDMAEYANRVPVEPENGPIAGGGQPMTEGEPTPEPENQTPSEAGN